MLGGFKMDPSHTQFLAFMEHYNYYNLIKHNTYFTGDVSCIDLILTNRKHCFKKTILFKTGVVYNMGVLGHLYLLGDFCTWRY